uniref:RhuM family protein n=1 Tax=Massilia sp. W12 TaxID=3126507 RepID=UPI00403F541C
MVELQAMRRIPMTMQDCEAHLSGCQKLWHREMLQVAGKVSAEIAKAHAETECEKYASCRACC